MAVVAHTVQFSACEGNLKAVSKRVVAIACDVSCSHFVARQEWLQDSARLMQCNPALRSWFSAKTGPDRRVEMANVQFHAFMVRPCVSGVEGIQGVSQCSQAPGRPRKFRQVAKRSILCRGTKRSNANRFSGMVTLPQVFSACA